MSSSGSRDEGYDKIGRLVSANIIEAGLRVPFTYLGLHETRMVLIEYMKASSSGGPRWDQVQSRLTVSYGGDRKPPVEGGEQTTMSAGQRQQKGIGHLRGSKNPVGQKIRPIDKADIVWPETMPGQ
ncbi:hypothetical protein BJF93_14355 [Xaviernesmea oryzae]|uniref:Uncharacterized protein n=1 Tax=Xaviernesmea oryzae TaxID=464029 RepID=A0A1Q9AXK5_9HYPH|nr:hypothetical protein BJF93_14355 [Xaviernesmea oryzae]